MNQQSIDVILQKHQMWLRGEDDGERAVLRGAVLRGAVLTDAVLRGADLRGAELMCTDFSGARLMSAIDFMMASFQRSESGYIAYKTFGSQYPVPESWDIRPGSIISETVNFTRTQTCGCGINVAPLEWVRNRYPNRTIWRCLIRWEWLVGVCIPYNSDGKIRCERVELLGIVEED